MNELVQKSAWARYKPYLYLLPMAVFFVVFILIPILYTLYLSFFDWNMVKPVKTFVGFGNYIDLFTSPTFLKVMGNTFFYILVIVIMNFFFAFIFAFVCKFIFTKSASFYKITLFLPSFISLVVGSMIFQWVLNPVCGPVARLLQSVGVTMPVWSTTEGLVMVVISLITCWKSFGYNFILLYAAVSGISYEVIEAARMDNIPLSKIFFTIVAPMSGSTAFYVFVTTVVQSLVYVYNPIDVLTSGGPDYGSANIIHYAYFKAFRLFDTGESAAVSVITLLVFSLGLYILNEVVGKKVYYEN